MPYVCQGKCSKSKKGTVQPYRMGKRYCAVCKSWEDQNSKNRCLCCNNKFRVKTTSKRSEKRKDVYKTETKHGLPYIAGGRRPSTVNE